MENIPKPKTLVLSSGGVYGALLVGAIKTLKEYNLLTDVKHYIGCSAGAIAIGGLLIDYSPEQMMNIILALDFKDWNQNLTATDGLIKAKKLTSALNEHLGDRKMKDFGVRITFSVINLNFGRVEYLDSETHPDLKVADAIMASCSLPVLFPSFKLNGFLYCDGGVVDPFPINFSEEPENTLGINCIRSEVGNFVEIKRGVSYILTVVGVLVNLLREEINRLKNYDKSEVIKVFSCYEKEISDAIDCSMERKVFMYHEGKNIAKEHIRSLSERILMKSEDSSTVQ